jgi:hypothetical protein
VRVYIRPTVVLHNPATLAPTHAHSHITILNRFGPENRIANPNWKNPLKTLDFCQKNTKFLAENPLRFPKNASNSPQNIDTLHDRLTLKIGRKEFWDPKYFIFHTLKTNFQNSPKNPLIPQRPKNSQICLFRGKNPRSWQPCLRNPQISHQQICHSYKLTLFWEMKEKSDYRQQGLKISKTHTEFCYN